MERKGLLKKHSSTLALFFIVIMMTATGCIACNKNALDKCHSGSISTLSQTGSTQHPVQSFALVMTKHSVTIKECLSPVCKDAPIPPVPLVMMSKGSSTVVGHKDGKTYSLTAAHVCMAPEPGVGPQGESLPFSYELKSELKLLDFKGIMHVATIVDANAKADVCLLSSEGIWSHAIAVSDEMPDIGTKVYNMAAPRGIFAPGMVPLFQGYYSGRDISGDEFFSIPTAPGSSGSAILNDDGEIVSIIHSAVRNFENLAIGSNLAIIRDLIDRNLE